jgi:hypothetical protein
MSTLLNVKNVKNVKNAKIPVFGGTKENFPVWWLRFQTFFEDVQFSSNIEGNS